MIAATIRDDLLSYRYRAELTCQELAAKAGISTERYQLLETGPTWPGDRAYLAVLDALEISGQERERLAFPGTPLAGTDRLVLDATQLWAVADSSWCITEASPAVTEHLPPANGGGNLLGWLLIDPDSQHRLTNHDESVLPHSAPSTPRAGPIPTTVHSLKCVTNCLLTSGTAPATGLLWTRPPGPGTRGTPLPSGTA